MGSITQSAKSTMEQSVLLWYGSFNLTVGLRCHFVTRNLKPRTNSSHCRTYEIIDNALVERSDVEEEDPVYVGSLLGDDGIQGLLAHLGSELVHQITHDGATESKEDRMTCAFRDQIKAWPGCMGPENS